MSTLKRLRTSPRVAGPQRTEVVLKRKRILANMWEALVDGLYNGQRDRARRKGKHLLGISAQIWKRIKTQQFSAKSSMFRVFAEIEAQLEEKIKLREQELERLRVMRRNMRDAMDETNRDRRLWDRTRYPVEPPPHHREIDPNEIFASIRAGGRGGQ